MSDARQREWRFYLEDMIDLGEKVLACADLRALTPLNCCDPFKLEDEDTWLEMLRDRNETSHVYDEATARRIYESIKRNFVALERVYGRLRALPP